MKKKIFSSRCVVCFTIIMLLLSFIYSTGVYAATIDDTFEGAEKFANSSYDLDTTALNSTSRFLYQLLLAIAMIVAVVIGLLLGIKYMTSSAEDKAEVMETLIPYVISCCVVFGAFTIWKIIVNILM